MVIIRGATGSGKTTLLPQFILDYYMEKGAPCSVVVTQPRKIGASSIARWVAQQRRCTLGSLVGYQVRIPRHDNLTESPSCAAFISLSNPTFIFLFFFLFSFPFSTQLLLLLQLSSSLCHPISDPHNTCLCAGGTGEDGHRTHSADLYDHRSTAAETGGSQEPH